MKEKVAAVGYYNVIFYLSIKSEVDMVKYSYLAKRIEAGEQMVMRDIYVWCRYQKIDYKTRFFYRRNFPIRANLWNFYSYLRGKWEVSRFV